MPEISDSLVRLTTQEVADILRMTPSYVLTLTHTGELTAENVGHPRKPRYLYRPAEVERFLASRRAVKA